MKKTNIILIALLIGAGVSTALGQEEFNIEIEPVTIAGAPSIHSYSWGKTNDDKWLIIGGRIDGLHQRQPFAAFLESSNNKDVFVIDPVNNQTWSASLSSLSSGLFEQLQSTNQQFYQRGNTLYVMGGYGYSTTLADHETFANLTAINVDSLANAVINGNSITPFFRQITDSTFAVTGGQLGYLDSTFYLAGGQYFEGRYNPMGPNQGPGFIQQYTDEVRMFKIIDDGTTLSITNFTTFHDVANLHRRDYNMSPQIFPNGDKGFTVWAGVFDPNDLPYLNPVDVLPTGHTLNSSFTQYLSQYHSAKMPVYDSTNNAMHTVFYGGLSQYTLDAANNLIQDDNVPFVKTISRVTRLSDGSMQEVKLNIEMPALLGTGAEFIPIYDTNYYIDEEILRINNIPFNKTLVGYIYGGIESTLDNIFFINDGTQSSASNQIFKVFINKSTVGLHEVPLTGENVFNMSVYPNPTTDVLRIELFIPDNTPHTLTLYNMKGQELKTIALDTQIGLKKIDLNMKEFSKGEYILSINGLTSSSQKTIIKE